MSEVKTRSRIDIFAAQIMKTRLEQGDAGYDELSQLTNLSVASVGRWVRLMRESGHTRITSYGPDRKGRPFVPLFTWGAGPDLPRPGQARPAKERMAELRSRRQAMRGQITKD